MLWRTLSDGPVAELSEISQAIILGLLGLPGLACLLIKIKRVKDSEVGIRMLSFL